jgi:hypothetical protein
VALSAVADLDVVPVAVVDGLVAVSAVAVSVIGRGTAAVVGVTVMAAVAVFVTAPSVASVVSDVVVSAVA